MEDEIRPKALMIPFDKFVILDILPPEQYKNTLTKMRDYVKCGTEPDGLEPIEQIAFESIRPFLDENIKNYTTTVKKNRKNGAKGGRPRKPKETDGFLDTHFDSDSKPSENHENLNSKYKVQNTNSNTNVLERIGDSKESPTSATAKSSRFHPPDIGEVKAYFAEKGGKDEQAQRFMDFYESNGWRVGKNPMKSWKAAASGWMARDKEREKDPVFQRNRARYVSRPPEEAEKTGDLFKDATDRTVKWIEKRKKENVDAAI